MDTKGSFVCFGDQEPLKLVDNTDSQNDRRTVPYQENEQTFSNFCTVIGTLV